MTSGDSRPVLQAEGVSKCYRLGVIGANNLGDEIGRYWSQLRGKADPLSRIDAPGAQRQGSEFWALRNVSFTVQHGEVLGIIGRNGAGKSTLLKLLSRITIPTQGTIRVRGSISSLLEVGTGFNPELTGRENIYLNGAILGMKKAEIDRKMDEIIDFSGIEHHLDTPVKRYSSGMKVRLGFSVAAHLEPDILIIDEVLAVGDAEFQRKCLGKMRHVSGSGRTILFVSHNMAAVKTLCSRVMWLEEGRVRNEGPTSSVVSEYMGAYIRYTDRVQWSPADAPGLDGVHLTDVAIERPPGNELTWRTPFSLSIGIMNSSYQRDELSVGIHLLNEEDVLLFGSSNREDPGIGIDKGRTELRVTIPGELLNVGDYKVTVNVFRAGHRLFAAEEAIAFHVQDTERTSAWMGRSKGIIRPVLQWSARTSGTGSAP